MSFFIAKTLKKNTHFTMKKTIICSYINYVHVSGVESIDNNIVEFKNGQSFTKLKGIKPAVYTSTTDPTTAGTILHETVSITAYSDEAAGLINSRQYYILQAVTSDANFIVGSTEYPALKTISNNKITATANFEASSPM